MKTNRLFIIMSLLCLSTGLQAADRRWLEAVTGKLEPEPQKNWNKKEANSKDRETKDRLSMFFNSVRCSSVLLLLLHLCAIFLGGCKCEHDQRHNDMHAIKSIPVNPPSASLSNDEIELVVIQDSSNRFTISIKNISSADLVFDKQLISGFEYSFFDSSGKPLVKNQIDKEDRKFQKDNFMILHDSETITGTLSPEVLFYCPSSVEALVGLDGERPPRNYFDTLGYLDKPYRIGNLPSQYYLLISVKYPISLRYYLGTAGYSTKNFPQVGTQCFSFFVEEQKGITAKKHHSMRRDVYPIDPMFSSDRDVTEDVPVEHIRRVPAVPPPTFHE